MTGLRSFAIKDIQVRLEIIMAVQKVFRASKEGYRAHRSQDRVKVVIMMERDQDRVGR